MIEIDVWGLAVMLGVPSAFTAFCVWLMQRGINRRDKKRDEAEAAKAKQESEREAAREQLQLLTVKAVNASLSLGEATARAVQRIPDAHCNGDMHSALEYASSVKRETQSFIERQGIHAVV